jgi:hypothetical protein
MVVTGLGLTLSACALPLPTPSHSSIPVVIVNQDDEPATVEVTFYRAIEGDERVVREPFSLPPGESTEVGIEPTFEENGAYHVLVNAYVAMTSEFMCDPSDIGQGSEELPSSVRVTIVDDGTPAACPLVEAD